MTGTDIAVTIGCTLFAASVGIVAGMVTSSNGAAQFRGSVEATLASMKEGFDEDIARLENVDRDQWKSIAKRRDEIGEVEQSVARIEGQLRSRSARAGG